MPVSQSRLSNILSGDVRVMDAMRDPEENYLVVVDMHIGGDVIQSVATTVSALPRDSLPFDDVRLNVSLPDYVPSGLARGRAHQLAVRIGQDTRVPLEFISRITNNIQRLVDSIGYAVVLVALEFRSGRRPDNNIVKAETRLNLVGTYTGSVGLLLETDKEDDQEGRSLVRNSLDEMFNLFERGQLSFDFDERYLEGVGDRQVRVASRYHDLLTTLGTSSDSTSISWYRDGGQMTREFELTPEFVRDTRDRAESTPLDIIRLIGAFESGNIRTGWFRFKEYGSDVSIGGRIHNRAVRNVAYVSLGRPCAVLVEPRLKSYRTTGETRSTYTFVHVDFDADDLQLEVPVVR